MKILEFVVGVGLLFLAKYAYYEELASVAWWIPLVYIAIGTLLLWQGIRYFSKKEEKNEK